MANTNDVSEMLAAILNSQSTILNSQQQVQKTVAALVEVTATRRIVIQQEPENTRFTVTLRTIRLIHAATLNTGYMDDVTVAAK